MSEHLLTLAMRIKSIADIGLLYNRNEYDIERYKELLEISFELLYRVSGLELSELKSFYKEVIDYPTPKVDVRGILLDEHQRILLVQESLDGKWSLPGGWADIGLKPKEVIVKEFKEETGLDVSPQKLLALYDKKCHPHPPQPHYVYKLIFHCTTLSHTFMKGFDVLDLQFFHIDSLPELSEDRILKTQMEELHHQVITQDWICKVD